MIRTATPEDMPQVMTLAREFHAYSTHRHFPLDDAAFEDFAGKLMEGGALFLSDDGMLGGMLVPLYFNPAVLLGVELFWWARKEGTALREAFEDWATERGASAMQFTGLADEKLDAVTRIYRRAGYVPAEVVFIKRG